MKFDRCRVVCIFQNDAILLKPTISYVRNLQIPYFLYVPEVKGMTSKGTCRCNIWIIDMHGVENALIKVCARQPIIFSHHIVRVPYRNSLRQAIIHIDDVVSSPKARTIVL